MKSSLFFFFFFSCLIVLSSSIVNAQAAPPQRHCPSPVDTPNGGLIYLDGYRLQGYFDNLYCVGYGCDSNNPVNWQFDFCNNEDVPLGGVVACKSFTSQMSENGAGCELNFNTIAAFPAFNLTTNALEFVYTATQNGISYQLTASVSCIMSPSISGLAFTNVPMYSVFKQSNGQINYLFNMSSPAACYGGGPNPPPPTPPPPTATTTTTVPPPKNSCKPIRVSSNSVISFKDLSLLKARLSKVQINVGNSFWTRTFKFSLCEFLASTTPGAYVEENSPDQTEQGLWTTMVEQPSYSASSNSVKFVYSGTVNKIASQLTVIVSCSPFTTGLKLPTNIIKGILNPSTNILELTANMLSAGVCPQ